MAVYERTDSPFFWMTLERPGQRPLRRSTGIPRQAATTTEAKEARQRAEQVYRAAMGDLARRRFNLPIERPQITFRAYRDWYADHVSVHKRGAARERSMLKQLGLHLDRFRIDQITREVALEWRTRRRKTVSAATTNREQELLVHMLGVAVPTYLDANPLKGMARLRTATRDVRILSREEEVRLLQQLAPADQALVVCALDTLARLSDVVTLRRDQDYGAYISLPDPKVKAYKVPVSSRLRVRLDALADAGPLYFAHHHQGKGPRSAQQSVIRMFEKACAAADIPLGRAEGGVSFHVLRHTGASRMLEAGVDVKTVMLIGGWKNLKVMERYLHPGDAQMRRAVDAIGSRPAHPRKLQAVK